MTDFKLFNTTRADFASVDHLQTGTSATLVRKLLIASGTLTAQQVYNHIITSSGASSITITLPTAAQLVSQLPNPVVNNVFALDVFNPYGSNTITIAVGSGGTATNSLAVSAGTGKKMMIWFTNVTAGSEAYSVTAV